MSPASLPMPLDPAYIGATWTQVLTLYDGDVNTPLDLTDRVLTMVLNRKGLPTASIDVTAVESEADPGVVSFEVDAEDTADWVRGNYAFEVRLTEGDEVRTILTGILPILKGAAEEGQDTAGARQDSSGVGLIVAAAGVVQVVLALSGLNGKSAYQVAVANGYEGTEQEYAEDPIEAAASATAAAAEATAAAAVASAMFVDTALSITASAGLQDALDDVRLRILEADATITLPAGATAISSVSWDHPNSDRIKLRGQTPLQRTATITSVTGSAGAWTVTATLDDATGVAVGMGLVTRSTYVTPGAYAANSPAKGELRMPFFMVGEALASASAIALTGALGATYFSTGDIAAVHGEIREVTSVAASSLGVDVAYSSASPSLQYFYQTKKLTGTITASGTALSGDGAAFSTELNVGDIIFPSGYGPRRITAIDDDDSATLDRAITITPAVAFGSCISPWRHEGAFIIDSVAGSTITWTNRNRTAQSKPPVNLMPGMSVAICPSTITSTGSGIIVEEGRTLDMADVVMSGPTGTTTVGIEARGTDQISAARVKLSGYSGVWGFGYAIRAGQGSVIDAATLRFAGQTTRGVDLSDFAQADLNAACGSGVNGIGIFCGVNAGLRYSGASIAGCNSDGIRREVGSAMWGDFMISSHNGARGDHAVGGVFTHVVGAWLLGNTTEGYIGENGGFGRATGLACLSNGSTGLTVSLGSLEAQQSWVAGHATNVVASGASTLNMNDGAATYASSDNVLVTAGARMVGSSLRLVGAADDGINVSGGDFVGTGLIFRANGTDVEYLAGGTVRLTSPVDLTTSNPVARNTVQTGGGVLWDGSTPAVASFLYGSLAQGGTVSALAASVTDLVTITVTGASLSSLKDRVSGVQANVALPAGLSVFGIITAADTVVVRAVNPTAANISVSNRTWHVTVMRQP